MIAVDIFADLFEWDDKQRERAYRSATAAKTLYMCARKGGAAASPVIFIEAAISVLDAINSYAGYRQAKEVTQQLELEGDALRKLLAELETQLNTTARVADLAAYTKLSRLRDHLALQDARLEIDHETFKSLSSQAKRLGQAIAALRQNSPRNCTHLLELERAYYKLVDAQLKTAMELVDE